MIAKTDGYNQVVNDVETYLAIAQKLMSHGVCVIGWSDEEHTHYDILFAVRVPQFGRLYGGQSGGNSLFVCVMHKSGFGFLNEGAHGRALSELYPSYVAEKLSIPGKTTQEKITQLINGVRGAYNGLNAGGGALAESDERG